jgi:hypothetical protein
MQGKLGEPATQVSCHPGALSNRRSWTSTTLMTGLMLVRRWYWLLLRAPAGPHSSTTLHRCDARRKCELGCGTREKSDTELVPGGRVDVMQGGRVTDAELHSVHCVALMTSVTCVRISLHGILGWQLINALLAQSGA